MTEAHTLLLDAMASVVHATNRCAHAAEVAVPGEFGAAEAAYSALLAAEAELEYCLAETAPV